MVDQVHALRAPAGSLRATRGRSLSMAAVFVVLAALTVGIGFIPHVQFVAMTVLVVAAFVSYMALRRRDGPTDLFEVIVPFSAIYITYFCVGALYLVYVPEALVFAALRPFLAPALALAVAGYLAFLLGYATLFRRTAPSRLAGLAPVHPLMIVVPATLGAAGLSVHIIQSTNLSSGLGISPVISLLQQFGSLYYFGWFMAWYILWSGRISAGRAIPVFAVLAVDTAIVLYFTIGSKSLAIIVLGLPAMAYYQVRGRLPKKALLATLLLTVFVIFPVYNAFRMEKRSLDTGRRLDRTLTAATRWSSNDYLDNSVGAFMKRITIVTSVAAIVSDTGRWVDYKYGETLFLAPIGLFIPRFVWPEKPNISIGREFGHTFRFVHPLDVDTEVAPSIIGDFYWNFGILGVVLGMPLMGAAYRWFYLRYGAGGGYDPLRKAVYATLLPTALLFEANVAIITAGAVKQLAILLACLVVARRLGWVRPVETSRPAEAGGAG